MRKCIKWFLTRDIKCKDHIMQQAGFKICCYLKQGYSLSLSKGMTKNELNLGSALIDHIARSNKQVLQLKELMKQENIQQPTKDKI